MEAFITTNRMINKVEILEITENELPELVYLGYNGDEELLEKFHVVKLESVDEAVEFELDLIKEHGKYLKWNYYKVLYAKIPIGYIVAFSDFIFSFALGIKYRTKEILKQWWDMCISFFGIGIKFGLVNNNKRAINYFKQRGMIIRFESEDKKEVLLTF